MLQTRKVVPFEKDSFFLEVLHFLFGVIDLKRQSRRLVGAGKFRTVEVDARIAALEREALASFVFRLQSECFLIEFACAFEVRDRDHRRCVSFSEHELLLS